MRISNSVPHPSPSLFGLNLPANQFHQVFDHNEANPKILLLNFGRGSLPK
jgi:hypothetical protein